MKYIIKIVLLLILIAIPEWAVAANSNYTHTHTNTPIELGFVSSNSAYEFKLAAVCFLGMGNCGNEVGFGSGGDDMGLDTGKQCQNDGFIYTASNCTLPNYLDKPCSYNENYYAECKKDIPRACKEAGYILVSQCASGQKLKAEQRCQWDNNYGICCKEACPANSSLTCTGAVAGDDTCGYTCKQCCSNSCPAGYDYTESQLTGSSGTGWIKDGSDSCDHCTRGKLYKRKATTIPSGYVRCDCGGSNSFKSGDYYYYSSCYCCSNCSGYYEDSTANCSYGYDSCKDKCTGKTTYSCRLCDNSGVYDVSKCGSYGGTPFVNECGYNVYRCCSDGRDSAGGCSYGSYSYTNECGKNRYECCSSCMTNGCSAGWKSDVSTDRCGKTCYSCNPYRAYSKITVSSRSDFTRCGKVKDGISSYLYAIQFQVRTYCRHVDTGNMGSSTRLVLYTLKKFNTEQECLNAETSTIAEVEGSHPEITHPSEPWCDASGYPPYPRY